MPCSIHTTTHSIGPRLKKGRAHPPYLLALGLMIHELVHVAQYEELGKNDYINKYFLQTGFYNKCENGYEVEAHTFEAKVSEIWGGQYCVALFSRHNNYMTGCGFALFPVCDSARSPAAVNHIALGAAWGISPATLTTILTD